MNNFYNFNNLISFNPDKQQGWNFYIWEYKPELTIDLSLSFYHRILVPDDIHIYYKNPRIGFFYVMQFEIHYLKQVNFHDTNNIHIIHTMPFGTPRSIHKPFDIFYIVFECKPGYWPGTFELYTIWRNIGLRPL